MKWLLFLLVVACSDSGSTGAVLAWVPFGTTPIIQYQDQIPPPPGPAGVWNDPSVLKEGALYRMWLTSSVAPGSADVSVYEATSSDGIAWTIDSNPQIVPGGTNGPWDDARCETPSVIQVAGTYHLFYSGNALGQIFRGAADWPCHESGRHRVDQADDRQGPDRFA